MVANARIEALSGFWTREFAYYLDEHRHPLNRLTHSVGVPIILSTMIAAFFLRSWILFLGGQAVGWAFQILGHRIEGNRPALLRRPLSLLMGPVMVLVDGLEHMGIDFEFARRARAAVSSPGPTTAGS